MLCSIFVFRKVNIDYYEHIVCKNSKIYNTRGYETANKWNIKFLRYGKSSF